MLFAVAAVACGGGKDPPAPQRFDGAPPPRRVIEPPPRDVRALPPHAITAAGVGPYKLRTPIADLSKALPSGPQTVLLNIPGVVDYAGARDEGLLIGGERFGDVSFIAVLREGIARTAHGVGVGAPAAALTPVGPAVSDPRIARDPDLWVGAALPGARFVLDQGRVLGVLLMAAPVAPDAITPGGSTGSAPSPPHPHGEADAGAGPAPPCERSAAPPDAYAGIVPLGLTYTPACLGAADGVAASGDIIVVAARGAGDTRARRLAVADVRGLRWVAPVRVEDGRDELVAVAEDRREGARVYSLVGLRLDGARLVKVAESEVYRLDEQHASWVGMSLDDLSLRLEVMADGDRLQVGGVLIHAAGGQAFTVAPLLPVSVRRRRPVEPDGERDRTRVDAGVDGPPAEVHHDAASDDP